ncbi:hypothetical protein FB451DRAFT_1342866 [Mycena latifolia]|nr:hypothetical protein FB451DRAFT_1342866 [Mycena latifolia]
MSRLTIPPSQQPLASTIVTLPRTLKRPTSSVDSFPRAILDVLTPELAEVPIPFIRHQIRACAEQFAAGFNALPLPGTIRCRHLPQTLTIPIPRDTKPANVEPLYYPTHLLAVVGPFIPLDAQVALIPVHSVVLAAHCASPLLGPPPAYVPEDTPGVVVLPICRVVLPSTPAVSVLCTYMYTECLERLLAAVLPLPVPLPHSAVKATLGSDAEIRRLATYLVDAHPGLDHLMGYSMHVRHGWQTACYMGMYHPPLWDALDLAWELVLASLNLAMNKRGLSLSFDCS